jgi:hypothetical protein
MRIHVIHVGRLDNWQGVDTFRSELSLGPIVIRPPQRGSDKERPIEEQYKDRTE